MSAEVAIKATQGTQPTTFQKIVLARAEAAAEWLMRSVAVCDGKGSAAYYSRLYHPLRGWDHAYPETTGYIIPTLIDYSKFSGSGKYSDAAIDLAHWVLSLQDADGALPGGCVVKARKEGPSIFNTGQMILGLVAASKQTHNDEFLNAAHRAASWLARNVDGSAGIWTKLAYVPGYSPAYYTRVCWPMLEVWVLTHDREIHSAAIKVLRTILSWQKPNGAIENWGFQPNARAFTHTIAYTIRGFLESARLLGSTGQEFQQGAVRISQALLRRAELRGKLAGAYDMNLKGCYWYSCLTGNCQMSIIWMKLCQATSDYRYLSVALKVLQTVIKIQRIRRISRCTYGSVPGSAPIFGRYLTMRYPNWATKFYLDALMLSHQMLQKMLKGGPCELQ